MVAEEELARRPRRKLLTSQSKVKSCLSLIFLLVYITIEYPMKELTREPWRDSWKLNYIFNFVFPNIGLTKPIGRVLMPWSLYLFLGFGYLVHASFGEGIDRFWNANGKYLKGRINRVNSIVIFLRSACYCRLTLPIKILSKTGASCSSKISGREIDGLDWVKNTRDNFQVESA